MKRHAIGPEVLPFGMGIGDIGLASKFATGPAADTQASPPSSSQHRLLRARRQRPRSRRAAEKRDEVASLHSITSSAATSSLSGTVKPSALAVLRLRVVSYLVGAWTGRSAGLAPRRMRST